MIKHIAQVKMASLETTCQGIPTIPLGFSGEQKEKERKKKEMHVPCVSLHYNMYLGHKIMFFTGQSIWCIIYNFTLEIHWNLRPPF